MELDRQFYQMFSSKCAYLKNKEGYTNRFSSKLHNKLVSYVLKLFHRNYTTGYLERDYSKMQF